MCGACEFPRPADVAPDDFAIALDAAQVRVIEGGSIAVGVSLVRHGTPDPVTVNVTGLPPGVTVDPLTIANDMGTLTLHAAVGAQQGVSTLNVIAMAGSLERNNPLSLLTTGSPGTLDHSFASGGTISTPLAGHATAVLIQPDGKIVIAGQVLALVLTRFRGHLPSLSPHDGGVHEEVVQADPQAQVVHA